MYDPFSSIRTRDCCRRLDRLETLVTIKQNGSCIAQ